MNTSTFTEGQMLDLIDNTIKTKTKFEISDFTGGYISVTINTNKKQTTTKVALLFGYKNRNSQSYIFEINEELLYIWIKAIKLKTESIKINNTGMDFNELNGLMNGRTSVRTNVHCTVPLPNTNRPFTNYQLPITQDEFENFKSFLDFKFFLIEKNKDETGKQFIYEFEETEVSISDGGKAYDRATTDNLDQATADRFFKFMWKELKNAHRVS